MSRIITVIHINNSSYFLLAIKLHSEVIMYFKRVSEKKVKHFSHYSLSIWSHLKILRISTVWKLLSYQAIAI